jgi:hypothetical protein
MKYNLILWLFYFVFCTVCFNEDNQRAQEQVNGIDFFVKSSEIFPVSFNNAHGIIQVEPAKTKEYKTITETGYSLTSSSELERSTLFTGYDRGTSPSLLVVERWESSSLTDNSSYNSIPVNLNSEKIADHRKLKVKDCETLLLGSNAHGTPK